MQSSFVCFPALSRAGTKGWVVVRERRFATNNTALCQPGFPSELALSEAEGSTLSTAKTVYPEHAEGQE